MKALYFPLGMFLLYFFTAAGYVDTIDATPSVETARALYQRGTLSFPSSHSWPTVFQPAPQKPGDFVSKMGLTFPLLYFGPTVIGLNLGTTLQSQNRWIEFFVSLVNPLLTSLLLFFCYSIFLAKGFSNKRALALSFLLGTTTLLWPYSKTCQREILQALCLVGMFWSIKKDKPFASGIFFSLGLLTKLAWVLPALPVVLLSLLTWKNSPRLRIFILTASVGILVYFLHAKLIWGSIGGTGYSSDTLSPLGGFWSTPFLTGVHSQLTSLDTGLLFLSPALFLVIFAALKKFFEKNWKTTDSLLLSSFLLQVFFYARWQDPLGGDTLGPRYLLVVLPLLAFLLEPGFIQSFSRPFARVLATLLLFTSFLLQFVFVSVKPQQFHTLKYASHGSLTQSQILTHTKFFFHKIKGKPEIYSATDFGSEVEEKIDLTEHRSFTGFNFWWAHLLRRKDSPPSSKIGLSSEPFPQG